MCLYLYTEKFDNVTILFSDIVSFTTIAAAVTPIDIVNMLNELYNHFDTLSNKHDVYKVRASLLYTRVNEGKCSVDSRMSRAKSKGLYDY